jgi:hypothetical protein
MEYPVIPITDSVSVCKVGDHAYYLWMNNRSVPVVEVVIRGDQVNVNWNCDDVRMTNERLFALVSRYQDRLAAAIARGAWPRREA